MKKTVTMLAAICLISIASAQTIRVPMNIFEGTIIRYAPGSPVYHLATCPEIAGAQTFLTDIFTAKLWGMKPCEKCLYKDQAVTPPAEMPAVGSMYEVGSWSGAANKNTETFEVKTPEWKIVWSTRGDSNFVLHVYDATSNRQIELAANIIGNGQDSTIIRGKGLFYLKISTSQDYQVRVYDNRK